MLELRNITKRYGYEAALDEVCLDIAGGQIHGLVGLNGSGKTTLLNILYGNPVIQASGGYSGQVILDGQVRCFTRPADAIAAGIGMIHQEFSLFNDLDITENITLTREHSHRATAFGGRDLSLVDKQADRVRAQNILTGLELTVDPDMHPARLSASMRQFVGIAREMDKRNLKLLLLDEPTAVMSQADADRLQIMLHRAARSGTAIVYVSHRLDEVTALCDDITVLRDGKVAGRFHRGCRDEDLAETMIGGEVVKARKRRSANGNKPVLLLRGFSVNLPGESIAGIDLDIHQGEILGLAGLSGHGKLALAMGVMGLHPFSGVLRLGGEQLAGATPSGMIKRGVYYLPEDRRTMGLLPAHSVLENMVLPAAWNSGRFLRRIPFTGLALLHRKACETYVRQHLEQLQVKCKSMHQPVDQLSGGNQQKVVIAQSLAARPRILFVSEPTRGVDLQARERILDILMTINQEHGTTLVIASSDLDELHRTCDRVAVIHKGRLADILDTCAPESDFALAFSAALGKAPQ